VVEEQRRESAAAITAKSARRYPVIVLRADGFTGSFLNGTWGNVPGLE